MFISPTKAIDAGWVTGDFKSEDVQSNGIDFRLLRLFQPSSLTSNEFVLLEDNKRHREYFEVEPYLREVFGQKVKGWGINATSSYDFISNLDVQLPNNVAAIIIQRSTLNRNSMMITSGLWDSGFKGTVGGQLRNNASTSAFFEHGVRIGQIVFIEAHSAYAYNGQYQNIFNHWTEQKGK